MPLPILRQNLAARNQAMASKDPTEDEIIDVALRNSPLKYQEILPTVFKSQGRLVTRWAYMREKIKFAKQEQKQQQKHDASVHGKESLSDLAAHDHPHNLPPTSPESLAIETSPKSTRKSKSKIAKRYRQYNKKHSIKVKDHPAPFRQSSKLSDPTNGNAHCQIDLPDDLGTSVSTQSDTDKDKQPLAILDTTLNRPSVQQRTDFLAPLAPPSSVQNEAVIGPKLAEWSHRSSANMMHKRSEPRPPTKKLCTVCRDAKCICSPMPHEDEEILCGNSSCDRKWWGREYLWKYCGIELKDAWEMQRKFDGWWLCPLCLTKTKAMTVQPSVQPNSPAATVFQSQNLTQPTPESVTTKDKSRLECELLDDSEIRDRLHRLTGLLYQYTTTARKRLSTKSHWRLFDVPSIQDEMLLGTKQPKDPFIQLVRKLIQAPDRVLVKDVLQAEGLVEMKCSTWVHGVLSDLVGDFIFDSDQPFGDATLMKRTLALAGISERDSERIVHDHRLRIARLYECSPHDPTIPADFVGHVAAQQQNFVENLNTSMLSLVGGNKETQKQHQEIAKVATELRLVISAYKGTFEPIRPQMNEAFEDLEMRSTIEDPDGRLVFLTTMMGIKYILPGKTSWRICLQARVELWPKRQSSTDSSRSITVSQMSTSHSNSHVVQGSSKKRRYDESET